METYHKLPEFPFPLQHLLGHLPSFFLPSLLFLTRAEYSLKVSSCLWSLSGLWTTASPPQSEGGCVIG